MTTVTAPTRSVSDTAQTIAGDLAAVVMFTVLWVLYKLPPILRFSSRIPYMPRHDETNPSATEGSRVADAILDELARTGARQSDPVVFWQGLLHTLLGGAMTEVGEDEVMQILRDALVVLPIAAAQTRGDAGKH